MTKYIFIALSLAVSCAVAVASPAKPYLDSMIVEATTLRTESSLILRVIQFNSETRLLSKRSPRPPLVVLELFSTPSIHLLDQVLVEQFLILSDGERLNLDRVSAVFLDDFKLSKDSFILQIKYFPLIEASFDVECIYRIQSSRFSKPVCGRVVETP